MTLSDSILSFMEAGAIKQGKEWIFLKPLYQKENISDNNTLQALKELERLKRITFCYKPAPCKNDAQDFYIMTEPDQNIDIYHANLI